MSLLLTDCRFVKNEEYADSYVCQKCGFVIVSPYPPDRIHRDCVTVKPKASNLDCKHRNELLRMEKCLTCNGDMKMKIFACSIFKECSLTNNLPNIQSCLNCIRYEPPE